MLYKAVIVHGLFDAQAVVALGRPVTLLSAPGAALFGGCLWWQELMQAAGVTSLSLLDCANAPGRALEALRLGLPGLILHPDVPAYTTIANQAKALLLPQAPPALDMAMPGATRRLAAWLD